MMTGHIRAYRIPTSLDEALRLLAREVDRAAVLSGGSMQALSLPPRVHTLIDLTRCGLDGIRVGKKTVQIGATVSAATIAATPALDDLGAGMLREAAGAITPQAVRNQVRLSGNLLGYMSWSDMPVALLALDARANLAKVGGKERSLALRELFAKHPRKVLQEGEIITGVEVERHGAAGGAFLKIARTVSDVALVNTAVYLELEAGICTTARVAVGAVRPRPQRAEAAEAVLTGATLDEATLAKAAARAVAGLSIATDARATKTYRRRLLEVAIKRCLELALGRAQGGAKYEPHRRPVPPPWTREAPSTEIGESLTAVIDGTRETIAIAPGDRLLDVLRREGHTSVKRGCDDGYCGACTVSVNGRILNACLVPAAHVDGCEITTVAGIGTIFEPHPLQRAFVDHAAVQCGYCTPGMIVAAESLLGQIPDPTEDEVKAALDGNLCRCTGYVKPLAAIRAAAEDMGKRAR